MTTSSRERTAPSSTRRAAAWIAAMVTAALLVAAAGLWAERREAQAQLDALQRVMAVHALGLRGAAEKYESLPFTTAQHPAVLALLGAPDDAGSRERVNAYLEEVNQHAGSAVLYVLDASGMTLAASNWRVPGSFVGQSYRNRPYFQDARDGRNGLFYGVGVTTSVPGLFIATPVRRDGAVIGVVAVKVSLDGLESTWARAREPVMLSDRRGIVFLGSVREWLYATTRPLSADDLAWEAEHQQYGPSREFRAMPWTVQRKAGEAEYRVLTAVGGKQKSYLAVDQPLPELGWTLTVMADHDEVTAARNLALALATLAAALLLVGALHWRLRERRFAEQRQARIELEQRVQERTRELRDAHAFRKAMEDSLLVGMRARDLEGRIIYVNPAFCEMVGYSADELMQRLPPYPYWHPDDLAQHWRDNEAALSGQAALNGFESRLRHRDGHDVYAMIYTARLIDSAGVQTGWMSSVVDITAQKRAEERQRLQDERLQRSARMASLGEMASTLAHELNQPLMALSNFAVAARALAEHGPSALLVASLDDIHAQARRAAEIVNRIRGFVRQQSGGMEVCHVNQIVDSVIALLKPETRRRQTQLRTTPAPEDLQVRGDHVLLEQALLNLVRNAMQAMQGMPAERRIVDIVVARHANDVSIAVSDLGPGVPAEAAAQMFEPFFTTRPEGLGLGLNICRTIIEGHGGRLGFENRAGGGATFSFELPLIAS